MKMVLGLNHGGIKHMDKVIHIPHSSIKIPKKYLSDYLISKKELKSESILMQDIFTDKLIKKTKNNKILKFKYSRLFCDVERFDNDTEEMNKIGMGILYTNNHDLKPIRNIKNKENILKYYYKYHDKFNNLTDRLLKKNDKILILDLHSYSDKALKYELHKELNRPDICIGIDNFHYDEKITNEILYIINKFNFTYSINEPFSGCMIPSKYYKKEKNVIGVMIEINKKLFENSSDKEKVKKLLKWINKI